MVSLILEGNKSSAIARIAYANDRIGELKSARASGRVDQKTFVQKLKYWMGVRSGSVGSPLSVSAGNSPGRTDLLSAGSFY